MTMPLDNQRPAEFVFEGLVKTMTQQREELEALQKAAQESERQAQTGTGQASDAA